MIQHKGDSECLLGGGAQDELCGFEKLPYDNFAGSFVELPRATRAQPPSFVRERAPRRASRRGARLGVNPFQLRHRREHRHAPRRAGRGRARDGFPGHGGAGHAAPAGELPPGLPDELEFNPGGLAVLWAEENSREALFAAMRRREAYGTSGPRIVVRFFGGYGLDPDLCGVRATSSPTATRTASRWAAILPTAPGGRRCPRSRSGRSAIPAPPRNRARRSSASRS